MLCPLDILLRKGKKAYRSPYWICREFPKADRIGYSFLILLGCPSRRYDLGTTVCPVSSSVSRQARRRQAPCPTSPTPCLGADQKARGLWERDCIAVKSQWWSDGQCAWLTSESKVNLIGFTNFIFTVIGPNLTSCHVKLILEHLKVDRFFVTLSLAMKFFSRRVVLSWRSPGFSSRWFSRPLLPKKRMVLNHAEFANLSGAFRPSWFSA